MKIIFENEHARIWLDGHSPILYSRVTSVPTEIESLKRLCGKYGAGVKRALQLYKKIYALFDFSDFRLNGSAELALFCANFLPGLNHRNILFKAFINPNGIIERRMMAEVVSAKGLNACAYSRFEEALAAINQLRQRNSTMTWLRPPHP